MSSSTTELNINDPVHISGRKQYEQQPMLEGIVAYMGPVRFGDRGNDWVGIKLTGSSIGRGKNDGSVQGERYFTCNKNCGVFVRRSKVIRRVLSRLEALKLKRELAAAKFNEESRKVNLNIKADKTMANNNNGCNSNSSTSSTKSSHTTLSSNERRKPIESEQNISEEMTTSDQSEDNNDSFNKMIGSSEFLRSKKENLLLQSRVTELQSKLQAREKEQFQAETTISKLQHQVKELKTLLYEKDDEIETLRKSLSEAVAVAEEYIDKVEAFELHS